MPEILFIEPFERGYEAGIRGDDPRTCPYEKMTKEYWEWQRAHKVATAIMDVDEHLGVDGQQQTTGKG